MLRCVLVVAPALFMVLAACEKSNSSNDDGGALDRQFLATSDLLAVKADPLSASEMQEDLKGDSVVFLNEDKESSFALGGLQRDLLVSDDAFGSDDECSGAEELRNTVLSASGDSARFGYAVSSPAHCSDGGVVTTVKVYLEFKVPGADFSALDGKKLSELTASDREQFLIRNANLSNIETRVTGKTNGFDSDSVFQTWFGGSDGGPCLRSKTGATTTVSNCRSISTSVIQLENGSSDTTVKGLRIFDFRDLTYAESGAAFYSSGSMDVVVNNWQGTVTYTGAEQSPEARMVFGGQDLKFKLFGESDAGDEDDRPADSSDVPGSSDTSGEDVDRDQDDGEDQPRVVDLRTDDDRALCPASNFADRHVMERRPTSLASDLPMTLNCIGVTTEGPSKRPLEFHAYSNTSSDQDDDLPLTRMDIGWNEDVVNEAPEIGRAYQAADSRISLFLLVMQPFGAPQGGAVTNYEVTGGTVTFLQIPQQLGDYLEMDLNLTVRGKEDGTIHTIKGRMKARYLIQ